MDQAPLQVIYTGEMADVDRAEEIWLKSSTREQMPVKLCDDRQVGNGRRGPTWQRMNDAFQDCKQRLRKAGDLSP